MRIVLKSWPEKIEIADKQTYFDPVDYNFIQFRRTDDAFRWLRPHLTNDVLMKSLRALLVSEKVSGAESMNNQQVAQKVAALLFQNKLALVQHYLLKHEPAVIVREEKAVAPPTQEAAVPRAASSPEPVVSPKEEPVDNRDHEAQAATLVAAAEEGTPFCEECEKAKQKEGNRSAA